jgi:signal transduction histidine kinase
VGLENCLLPREQLPEISAVTQSRSADAIPSGAMAAQRNTGLALALRNWRVARQLIVLIAIPAVLILVLTGLRVTDATQSAGAYGQVGTLATVGQQVAGLAQAMADERTGTAVFISSGRPAAGLPALRRQYAVTDGRAASVRQAVAQIGPGYPAQTRADAAQALASIAKLPGLRREATQSQASAMTVITGYSAATSGLFPVIDGIADQSGNPTLVSSVRGLGSLSRMLDHASQQQAILDVALAGGRFGPGALTALTIAQAQQASDLASFRGSATPEESWALTMALARPLPQQAQAVEQQATGAGNGSLTLGPQASQQWSAGMSFTVGWMGRDEQQLAQWITANAQALQQSAMRSAMLTGAAGLGALALVFLGTIFAARSMVRRLRRLEVAALGGTLEGGALEGYGAQLAITASAVPASFFWRNHALLERLLQLIDSSELNEEDPQRLANLFEMDHLATRIWRNSDSALVLAGHEIPRPAEPLALVDVLRAAASEIEEYGRLTLDVQQGVQVNGSAATDTVHLLAELLENATTFSPETTQVTVSGYAVGGGGSLISITDHGAGMSEEELTLLNWQLANPSPEDMVVARHMGLFAVALLAARHGITVTLSMPPDGGTTAEVYLPAALISLDAEPGGWQEWAFEGPSAGASEETGATQEPGASEEAGTEAADTPFSAVRFASGPAPPLAPETGAPEAVPLMLNAPSPSPAPAPGTLIGAAEPGPAKEPAGGSPIFESVRSGYQHAFGRDRPPSSEPQAGQSPAGEPDEPAVAQPAKPPASQPAKPPAAWGDGNGRAVADPPTADPPMAGPSTADPSAAGRRAPSGLPQRTPQPGQVRGTTADQETQQAPAAESAEITRSRLASFQNGSRRARAVARMNRSEQQPEQDD